MADNFCSSITSKSSRSILSGVWLYFAIAYGWTWAFWMAAVQLGISMNTTFGTELLMLGLLGPAVAGVGLTYLTQDKKGRHDYWQRVTDIRRISFRWYLVIFLFYPAISALAALLDILTGGSGMVLGKAVENLAIITTMITLFLPAFMEELGWRGYALDRLQLRGSALLSSLILGTLWAFWHTPLFLFKDSIQYKMGFGSRTFWIFIAGVVFMAIIMTWIFNNTHRSTLSAILWHAVANGTAGLFTLTERASNYSVVLMLVAAVIVARIWGAKTMTDQNITGRSDYPQIYAK